jgi:hypothetical protein
MNQEVLPSLPAAASVWIYAADRDLTADEVDILYARLAEFIDSWKTHGRSVQGEAAIVAERFVVIGGYLEGGDISGCGIDASTGALNEASGALGFGWEPLLNVFYRDAENRIRAVSRQEFRSLAGSGAIHAATRVFDPAVSTLGQLRAQGLERPAGLSWHSRLLATAPVC